jgi:[protein-PII] uridylyltransferase
MSTPVSLPAAADESLLQETELRRWLSGGVADRSRLRQALGQLDQQQWTALQQGVPIEQLMQVRVAWIDGLLSLAWKHFLGDCAAVLCLAATGGYGRRELQPHSDIDVLILLPAEVDPACMAPLERFLTFLWDIGLQVGHSVRTVAECAEMAGADLTVMSNLLESRVLDGDRHLLEAMRAATSPRRMWNSQDFFTAKVAEQNARHHKFHDTGYQLEPNVKESPGGLRDIHTIGWVAKRHFQAETLHELREHGFLTERELRSLVDSQRFLWRVRWALHMLTGRREDRLLFDVQLKLAGLFGYCDQDNNLAVEQFMQHYYRTVTRISRLNELLLQLFDETLLHPNDHAPPIPLNARFQVRHGHIEVTRPDVFRRSPFALLEIFLLLMEHPEIQGVRAATIRLIRQHRYLIDGPFRDDIRARSLFMEMLNQPHGITHELRRMNRYGILARYLPEFGALVGLMQFDLFHAYTVDQHLLFVVRNLRRITVPEFAHEYPLCSEIVERIPKRELLYIAGLYHDMGKGRGGDHSDVGGQLASAFCCRHGLGERDTELVVWLVRNHLLMSMTAQRRDISDPQEIHAFARKVRTRLRLDHLFLLTVADMRGTNPALLTDWKFRLLSQLYHATREAIERGLDRPLDAAEVAAENREEALSQLARSGVDQGRAQALWDGFPEAYFLRHQGDEIAWQTRALLLAGRPHVPVIQLRPDNDRGSTAIFLYLPDRDYLFGLISAVLCQLGLTIQDARISSTVDGWALDTFMVLEQNGCFVNDHHRLQEIREQLTRILDNPPVDGFLVTRRSSRQARVFHTPPQIHFRDDPGPHTAMELIAADRPGLLSCVGQIFARHGIRVHAAKIATIGERAEDVFWITDARGRIDDPTIRATLTAVLTAALNDATE